MITLCLNVFADLDSFRSISIAFHKLGNITDGKHFRFLFNPKQAGGGRLVPPL